MLDFMTCNEKLHQIIQNGDAINSDFLGLFKDRLLLFKESVAPTNLGTSCFLFFEKFFDSNFCPVCDEEIEEMVEWCLYSVQFTESNLTRISATLTVLTEVQNYLYVSKLNSMYNMSYDNLDSPVSRFDGGPILNDLVSQSKLTIDNETQTFENKNAEVTIKDGSGILTKAYFDYSDTKRCDCAEYEASGDCYHVDDLGVITSV